MDICENYLTIHMEVELLSTLKMGKTILMTPNVLEICFQQTATFQKQTYFFNKTITHWFQEVPSRSLMQSLQFPQSLSSSLKVSQVLSKTVSQVPSRFLKFFQTVPQVSSGSLRSLRVSQGPSRSLRVPQNVSRSSWIKKTHQTTRDHIATRWHTYKFEDKCAISQTL